MAPPPNGQRAPGPTHRQNSPLLPARDHSTRRNSRIFSLLLKSALLLGQNSFRHVNIQQI